jgi:hypothetical protein
MVEGAVDRIVGAEEGMEAVAVIILLMAGEEAATAVEVAVEAVID